MRFSEVIGQENEAVTPENLLGSELVVGKKASAKARELAQFTQSYLGARLSSCLDLKRRVTRAIEDVKKAKKRHLKFDAMTHDFLKFARGHPEAVSTRFGNVIPDADDSESDSV